jgi:hypothetical protein
MFAFTYMCIHCLHCTHPLTPFPYPFPLLLVPIPQPSTESVLPSCSLIF